MSNQELNFEPSKDPESGIQSQPLKKSNRPLEDPKLVKEGENQDFEKSLKRLEVIVGEMENSELSLNQSMKYFEEGTKLANYCSAKLAKTENQIEILLKEGDEKKWSNFEEDLAE